VSGRRVADVIDTTEDRLLTIAEAMVILGCSRKTVYRLFDAGKLRRVYVAPRAPRVRASELAAIVGAA
jgi:excisionase family DNA binding protein